MDRQIACSDGGFEQLCPSVCRRHAAIEFSSGVSLEGGLARLGLGQSPAALCTPAPARGFFLHRVASDTPAASPGIAETVDARTSVSLMGSRAAHACQRSRDGVGKRGHRTIRGRSRANDMD